MSNAAAELPPETVTWSTHGVFWTGISGNPIERVDNPQPGDGPLLDDDMAAALVVAAHSTARWVTYWERAPDSARSWVVSDDDPSWQVTAFADEASASAFVDELLAAANRVAFYFDGRIATPEDAPHGYGYRPPPAPSAGDQPPLS